MGVKTMNINRRNILDFLTKPFYVGLLPIVPTLIVYYSNLNRLTLKHCILSSIILLAFYLAINFTIFYFVSIFSEKFKYKIFPIIAVTFIILLLPLFVNNAEPYFYLSVILILVFCFVITMYSETEKFISVFLNTLTISIVFQLAISISISPIWEKRSEIEKITNKAFNSNVDFETTYDLTEKYDDKRDIYYLIFDRYARADVLNHIYKYDNSKFLSELKLRGFTVLDNSFANYQRTTHSLISSLNFSYLDPIENDITLGSSDWVPLYKMLDESKIIRFLKLKNYQIYHFGSWWEPTRQNPNADYSFNWYDMPEVLRVIYENSFILTAVRIIGIKKLDPRWMQYQRSNLMFEKIRNLKKGKPKFIFAHFLLPHPPFVTHETGRFMSIAEAEKRTRKDNYIGQIKHLNKKIIDLIDSILNNSRTKPIIILQSDEGPWPKEFAGEEIKKLGRDVTSVKWSRVDKKILKEKLGIFAAISLPDKNINLPNDTSPVNIFRVVLKNYFGLKMKYLSNRILIFEDNKNLYRFIDVSEVLATE